MCALNRQCKRPLPFYDPVNNKYFQIHGFTQGCYSIESLLFSTFQCLYSNNSECLSTLIINVIKDDWIRYNSSTVPLNSSMLSRFLETDNVSTIISRLMVEEWSHVISYENYFDICAPKQCKYQQIESSGIVDIISNLISLYGGLSILLRLILPQVIKIFFKKTSLVQMNPSRSKYIYHRKCENIKHSFICFKIHVYHFAFVFNVFF
jgi:hypothetical protein